MNNFKLCILCVILCFVLVLFALCEQGALCVFSSHKNLNSYLSPYLISSGYSKSTDLIKDEPTSHDIVPYNPDHLIEQMKESSSDSSVQGWDLSHLIRSVLRVILYRENVEDNRRLINQLYDFLRKCSDDNLSNHIEKIPVELVAILILNPDSRIGIAAEKCLRRLSKLEIYEIDIDDQITDMINEIVNKYLSSQEARYETDRNKTAPADTQYVAVKKPGDNVYPGHVIIDYKINEYMSRLLVVLKYVHNIELHDVVKTLLKKVEDPKYTVEILDIVYLLSKKFKSISFTKELNRILISRLTEIRTLINTQARGLMKETDAVKMLIKDKEKIIQAVVRALSVASDYKTIGELTDILERNGLSLDTRIVILDCCLALDKRQSIKLVFIEANKIHERYTHALENKNTYKTCMMKLIKIIGKHQVRGEKAVQIVLNALDDMDLETLEKFECAKTLANIGARVDPRYAVSMLNSRKFDKELYLDAAKAIGFIIKIIDKAQGVKKVASVLNSQIVECGTHVLRCGLARSIIGAFNLDNGIPEKKEEYTIKDYQNMGYYFIREAISAIIKLRDFEKIAKFLVSIRQVGERTQVSEEKETIYKALKQIYALIEKDKKFGEFKEYISKELGVETHEIEACLFHGLDEQHTRMYNDILAAKKVKQAV